MANLNIDAKKELTYDAIVIGSGVSGGWAAKELTEKGLRVLMLERGKQLEHITGYENALKSPWELKYDGRLTVEQIESHPKVSRDYPYNEMTEKYWFRDADSLYREEKRFDWFRPNIVGGKSIMWGRQSYRWSDFDFEANLRDGIAVDWPIRYADLAPWYSYVEKFAGISGEKLGLPQLPDGEFLPPMEMYFLEKEVRKRIEQQFPGRVMTIGRVANLSKAAESSHCESRKWSLVMFSKIFALTFEGPSVASLAQLLYATHLGLPGCLLRLDLRRLTMARSLLVLHLLSRI